MASSNSDLILKPLELELQHWKNQGKNAQLFWRDDDAVKITPDLEHLNRLSCQFELPVLLAIIPEFLEDDLVPFVHQNPLLAPAVHGISHYNHASPDEKKCELGDHRPIDQTLGDLKRVRELMLKQFGNRLSEALVPPWNRISDPVASGVPEIGFGYISGFSWKFRDNGNVWLNTHVDIIDWKDNKRCRSLAEVVADLVNNLGISRENGFQPVGILTHHLDHDAACWNMLEELFLHLSKMESVSILPADEIAFSLAQTN